jgi:hypothetical protein
VKLSCCWLCLCVSRVRASALFSSYNQHKGSTSPEACVSCAPGKYQDQSNSTACRLCAAGKFSTTGSASCQDCPSGRYQTMTGQYACTPCDAGKYLVTQGANNASMCLDCPDYAPLSESGASSKLQCSPPVCSDDYWTPPGAALCSAHCTSG